MLAVGGAAAVLAGSALAGLGIAAGDWLRALLPPVTAGAPAIGGAAAAVGSGLALIGLAQIVTALVLPGGRPAVSAAGLLAAILATAFLAGATAALVTALQGIGASLALYGLAAAALVAAVVYATAARRCIGVLASMPPT